MNAEITCNIIAFPMCRWCAMQDGRHSTAELAVLIEKGDTYYAAAKARIIQTDVLIIDEISMLSRVMFGQIDHLCRHVRGIQAVFGGLQVVLPGRLRIRSRLMNGKLNLL